MRIRRLGLLGKPRIFLSYASRDAEVAERFYRLLIDRGFMVFRDSAEIAAGENFVERILVNLRRADAVVSLQSPSSTASDWCQAELHHAYALRKAVFPVRIGERSELTRPLGLLQRQVHTLEVGRDAALEDLPAELEKDLATARRRVRWRQARVLVSVTLAALILAWPVALVVSRIDDLQDRQARATVIERIESAGKVLSRETFESYGARFATDSELLKSLLLLREDDSRSDTTRLNAWLLGSTLLAKRNDERRWVVEDVEMARLEVEEAKLDGVTFASGTIRDVVFRNSTFSGVVWNAGPGSGAPGLVLSGLRFVDSDFYFTWFAGTTAVGVDFVNSSFRGAEIDLSGFALARFVSEASRPELQTLVTDEVTVIENSIILNRNPPPAPGVMDLSVPTEEAYFDRVVFVGTHFRGYIRPEWFHRSSFRNCVFPENLSKEDLLLNGNSIENSHWGDESLD